MLVEAVRLLITLTATAIGLAIGNAAGEGDTSSAPILGAVIGAGIGYVLGGAVGRAIRSRLDQAPQRFAPNRSGSELFAGAFGLLIGLVFGVVVAVPLVIFLPPMVGWSLGALVVLLATAFAARLFESRAEDLVGAAGLRARQPLVTKSLNGDGAGYMLDSSAAIDGRVLELARAGLVQGRLWVPVLMLDELQALADAAEVSRRRRGRRGLDVVHALGDVPGLEVAVLEETVPEFEDVDAKLVALADRASASLITTDHNLSRNAEARGIRVLNPQSVAELLRSPVSVGDHLVVPLSRSGTEPGQAVGYLEDGTMVVVDSGTESIGREVAVEVIGATRTSVGRMLFARLDE
ncbi:MAG: PIN/TRAM domain-containing protein [Acidimicrobiia bacterium]